MKNPAHFCFNCNEYIGHRGFCSKKCHDEWYDKHSEEDEWDNPRVGHRTISIEGG